jgi:hypothetical protein
MTLQAYAALRPHSSSLVLVISHAYANSAALPVQFVNAHCQH